VRQLIELLSLAGEFPFHGLTLLGSERTLQALIAKLSVKQTIRNFDTGEEISCRLLTVAGKGRAKSLRLYKGALPVLDWLHPDAYRYYMDAFWGHHFPGDAAHRERNWRVAEAAALCMRAGFEGRSWLLPKLQREARQSVIPEKPCFYFARDIKRAGEGELNKTMFTRVTGALFASHQCCAVYNTRDAVMRWGGMGEMKTLYRFMEVARLNGGISGMDSAILLGQSEEIAMRTLLESDRSRSLDLRFDSVYRHVYFVPMDGNGLRQLRLFSVPDWRERLLSLLFEDAFRSYDRGLFEYDACVDGVYVLSHLDGDIARLLRFREGIESQSGPFEVLCCPYQVKFLREYLGEAVRLKTVSLDDVETGLGLGIEGEDRFET